MQQLFGANYFCGQKDASFFPSCPWVLEAGTPGVQKKGFSRSTTIVKIDPLLPHVRDTLLPKPVLGQCPLDYAVTAHTPIAFAAASGEFHLVSRYAQCRQVPTSCTRAFPLFPVAQPDSSPEPLVQAHQFVAAATCPEVVEPAPYIQGT